jgi:hypothetical protein
MRVSTVRNLKLTVIIDAELRGILAEGAEREGRSISSFSRRLLDRAARETAVRAWQTEQPVPSQRSSAA